MLRQQTLAPVDAPVQKQPRKGEVVVRRREQATRARWKCRRPGPQVRTCEPLHLHLASLEVGRILARQPAGLLGGDGEGGVPHAQRLEDAPAEELLQWL